MRHFRVEALAGGATEVAASPRRRSQAIARISRRPRAGQEGS